MENSKITIKKYGSIDMLFLDAFFFCNSNSGINLLVIEDDIVREDYIHFVKIRNAYLIDDPLSDSKGCIISKEFLDDLSMLYISGVLVISLDRDYEMKNEIAPDSRCFVCILDMDLSHDDLWDDSGLFKSDDKYPSVQCFLMNADLRDMFIKTFYLAEKEIDLICPWLNHYVVNEKLIKMFHNAISRGVTIKVTYGIGTDEGDKRKITTESTVQMLKKRLGNTDKIKFNKGNTHIKCLICDEKYMMVGSYNFLSFAAEYEDLNVQDEGMEYIVDVNQISQRRKQLFSWD